MTTQTNNFWLDANWPAPNNVHAGTSIRTGGYSKKPYDALNLALHVGDAADNVKKNRSTLSKHLKLQSEPVWLNQIHSSKIISIDTPSDNLDADASLTTKQNKICVVMTADCVPILFCNQNGTKVAAIHAGWKGICNGIIENAIKAFSQPQTILAWIGPCIGKDYYEIGKDVYESCLGHSNSLKNAFRQTDTVHWQADLTIMAKIILKKEGVGSIHECGLCTYKMDKMFYSYRRDGHTGRTASMIWME